MQDQELFDTVFDEISKRVTCYKTTSSWFTSKAFIFEDTNAINIRKTIAVLKNLALSPIIRQDLFYDESFSNGGLVTFRLDLPFNRQQFLSALTIIKMGG